MRVVPAGSAVRKARGRGRLRRLASGMKAAWGVGWLRRRRAAGSCGGGGEVLVVGLRVGLMSACRGREEEEEEGERRKGKGGMRKREGRKTYMRTMTIPHIPPPDRKRHQQITQRAIQRPAQLEQLQVRPHALDISADGPEPKLLLPHLQALALALAAPFPERDLLLQSLGAGERFRVRGLGESEFVADGTFPHFGTGMRRDAFPPEFAGARFPDRGVPVRKDVLFPDAEERRFRVVPRALGGGCLGRSLFVCASSTSVNRLFGTRMGIGGRVKSSPASRLSSIMR